MGVGVGVYGCGCVQCLTRYIQFVPTNWSGVPTDGLPGFIVPCRRGYFHMPDSHLLSAGPHDRRSLEHALSELGADTS